MKARVNSVQLETF